MVGNGVVESGGSIGAGEGAAAGGSAEVALAMYKKPVITANPKEMRTNILCLALMMMPYMKSIAFACGPPLFLWRADVLVRRGG